MQPSSVLEFEQTQKILFRNKALLQQAFVHRSYVNERATSEESVEELLLDNERLEFLGDAILGFITSEMLYSRFPEHQEGQLTHIRTKLVRKETLAQFANEMEMGRYLRLGIGEEDGGGRDRIPTLCATFEAFLGALYLDQGLEAARAFIQPRLDAELERTEKMAKDPKSRLQEWAQLSKGFTPRYKVVDSSGPDHSKTFIMQVQIDRVPHGVGKGRSKQEATQAAAAMALHRGGQIAPEYEPNLELEAEYMTKKG